MAKKKQTYPSMIELEKEPKPEPKPQQPKKVEPKPDPKPQSKPNSPEETNADDVLDSLVGKMDGMDKDEKYEFIMKKAHQYKNSLTTDQRLTETANMERDREIKMLRAQLKEMELEEEKKAAFEAAVAEAHPDMVAGGRKKRKSKKRKSKKRKSKKRRTKRRTKRR